MDLYCENTNLQLNRKFLRAVSNRVQRTRQTASSSLWGTQGRQQGQNPKPREPCSCWEERKRIQTGGSCDWRPHLLSHAQPPGSWAEGEVALIHPKGILSFSWLTNLMFSSYPISVFSTAFSRVHSQFSRSIKRLMSKYVLHSSPISMCLWWHGVGGGVFGSLQVRSWKAGHSSALLEAHG